MASQTVAMPQLGESVTEGTVIQWLKKEGETIARDESLLEVETEKVTVEVPSPYQGTITKILVQEGETVAVGVQLAEIETAAAQGSGSTPPPAAPEATPVEASAQTSQTPETPQS